MRSDNPWWRAGFAAPWQDWPRRAYFLPFHNLLASSVQRAVLLLGARRVGKTTLLRQVIAAATLDARFGPVLYASVDTPAYTGLRLEQFVDLFVQEAPHDPAAPRLIIFDEIQYLPDWERHLKDLVDRYPRTRFVASGSAAAALRRRSQESGAGRFTEFELPPLTFAEFLHFVGEDAALLDDPAPDRPVFPTVRDPVRLNARFVDYINFGGYPELVLNGALETDMERFVRNDIIDKVLLRDLPSLYGINNVTELNRLFSTLAYNTGQLVSPDEIAKHSGITKPTIMRYLDYLEAAFLIVRLRRIDETARQLQRERNFKVYLTNPSMRAALFGSVAATEDVMGAMAETALVTQYLHAPVFRNLAFARWKRGEVDLVRMDAARQKPEWALDVKWSDTATRAADWKPLLDLAGQHGLQRVVMTSRTVSATMQRQGIECVARPLAALAFKIGRLAAARAATLSSARVDFAEPELPPTPPAA